MIGRTGGSFDRRRAGWWLVGLGLAVVVGIVARAFVGTLVFGLFVYYAVRPIHRRLLPYADTRIEATVTTLVVAAVPGLLVLIYGTGLALGELLDAVGPDTAQLVIEQLFGDSDRVTAVMDDPARAVENFDALGQIRQNLSTTLTTVGLVGGALLRLSLSLAVCFFLLQDGHRIESWFREDVADGESTAYVYLRGADADLETVYFGNVLTVIGVTIASIVVYNAYNFLAPAAVSLPVPTLLAVLTGLATFVPIVVGKLVYLPVGVYLFAQAASADGSFLFPVGFIAVAFVFLDVLPQTFVRPYISGRSLHSGLVLFGYVFGAAYFGWYGLFLGPLLVVVSVQFLKHVLPDLVGGDEVVPDHDEGVDIGTDPLTEGGPDVPATPEEHTAGPEPDVDGTDPDHDDAGDPPGDPAGG